MTHWDHALRFAYARSGGTEEASSLAEQVSRIVSVYSEDADVDLIDVIDGHPHTAVLTRETNRTAKAPRTWRGIHLWTFEGERCARFEAYLQALVVIPPEPGQPDGPNV